MGRVVAAIVVWTVLAALLLAGLAFSDFLQLRNFMVLRCTYANRPPQDQMCDKSQEPRGCECDYRAQQVNGAKR